MSANEMKHEFSIRYVGEASGSVSVAKKIYLRGIRKPEKLLAKELTQKQKRRILKC